VRGNSWRVVRKKSGEWQKRMRDRKGSIVKDFSHKCRKKVEGKRVALRKCLEE
jgi:hypothetical protein